MTFLEWGIFFLFAVLILCVNLGKHRLLLGGCAWDRAIVLILSSSVSEMPNNLRWVRMGSDHGPRSYNEFLLCWWAGMGSDHGPRSYQERALPLSHRPSSAKIRYVKLRCVMTKSELFDISLQKRYQQRALPSDGKLGLPLSHAPPSTFVFYHFILTYSSYLT